MKPEITPSKIYPFLKKADTEQIETLYRFSHHVIRGKPPEDHTVPLSEFMVLLQEGSGRQLLLIIQAAFHIVQRDRVN